MPGQAGGKKGRLPMENGTNRFRAGGAGLLAGLACGLLGGGGGMILIPLLTAWLGLPARKAFATSVGIMAPLCLAAAGAYALRGRLDLVTALPYMAGGVLGGLLAGRTLDRVPVKWLRLALAALLLYGGGRALLWS